jgi:hypothetical protein
LTSAVEQAFSEKRATAAKAAAVSWVTRIFLIEFMVGVGL